ncbi:DUF397 domain-containing protein [Kineosporia sp. R_H_3]|uniref:DUF397 domain-containing protein n=1 Tax=Kineosporia sp. R_H_3 TaxID=1961848 RepID=UPI000B4B966C|nr:DUF397 domain-containing protein [Kineosporia sp. R_H_3]
MDRVENGMPGASLRDLSWTKSRRSGPAGNCVEMAVLPAGDGVAVRNSRFPEGPVLVYTDAEIEALVLGVKDGDFDFLLERTQGAG